MSRKSRLFTYLCYAMFAIFILSAAVQYNDPDPLLWIVVYGGAALITWLFARNRLNWMVPAAACGLLLVWAASLLPQVWGVVSLPDLFESVQMKDETVETAREAGGILIIAAWFAVLGWQAFKTTAEHGNDPQARQNSGS